MMPRTPSIPSSPYPAIFNSFTNSLLVMYHRQHSVISSASRLPPSHLSIFSILQGTLTRSWRTGTPQGSNEILESSTDHHCHKKEMEPRLTVGKWSGATVCLHHFTLVGRVIRSEHHPATEAAFLMPVCSHRSVVLLYIYNKSLCRFGFITSPSDTLFNWEVEKLYFLFRWTGSLNRATLVRGWSHNWH